MREFRILMDLVLLSLLDIIKWSVLVRSLH
jgi:hypothetical protein